jgi:hypothetical protein
VSSETAGLCFTEKLFRGPLTRMGWWAVGLEALFVALVGVMIAWGSAARWGLNPAANVLAGATMVSAVAAGAVSAIAIVREGERSLALFAAALMGLAVLILSTALLA